MESTETQLSSSDSSSFGFSSKDDVVNDQPGVVSIEEANDTSQPQPLTGEEDTEPSFTVKHVRDLVLVAKHRAATQNFYTSIGDAAYAVRKDWNLPSQPPVRKSTPRHQGEFCDACSAPLEFPSDRDITTNIPRFMPSCCHILCSACISTHITCTISNVCPVSSCGVTSGDASDTYAFAFTATTWMRKRLFSTADAATSSNDDRLASLNCSGCARLSTSLSDSKDTLTTTSTTSSQQLVLEQEEKRTDLSSTLRGNHAARWHCSACDISFCDEYLTSHTTSPLTCSHDVVHIASLDPVQEHNAKLTRCAKPEHKDAPITWMHDEKDTFHCDQCADVDDVAKETRLGATEVLDHVYETILSRLNYSEGSFTKAVRLCQEIEDRLQYEDSVGEIEKAMRDVRLSRENNAEKSRRICSAEDAIANERRNTLQSYIKTVRPVISTITKLMQQVGVLARSSVSDPSGEMQFISKLKAPPSSVALVHHVAQQVLKLETYLDAATSKTRKYFDAIASVFPGTGSSDARLSTSLEELRVAVRVALEVHHGKPYWLTPLQAFATLRAVVFDESEEPLMLDVYARCTNVPLVWLALGRCHQRGIGTEIDHHSAMKWYTKAAKAGLLWALELRAECEAESNWLGIEFARVKRIGQATTTTTAATTATTTEAEAQMNNAGEGLDSETPSKSDGVGRDDEGEERKVAVEKEANDGSSSEGGNEKKNNDILDEDEEEDDHDDVFSDTDSDFPPSESSETDVPEGSLLEFEADAISRATIYLQIAQNKKNSPLNASIALLLFIRTWNLHPNIRKLFELPSSSPLRHCSGYVGNSGDDEVSATSANAATAGNTDDKDVDVVSDALENRILPALLSEDQSVLAAFTLANVDLRQHTRQPATWLSQMRRAAVEGGLVCVHRRIAEELLTGVCATTSSDMRRDKSLKVGSGCDIGEDNERTATTSDDVEWLQQGCASLTWLLDRAIGVSDGGASTSSAVSTTSIRDPTPATVSTTTETAVATHLQQLSIQVAVAELYVQYQNQQRMSTTSYSHPAVSAALSSLTAKCSEGVLVQWLHAAAMLGYSPARVSIALIYLSSTTLQHKQQRERERVRMMINAACKPRSPLAAALCRDILHLERGSRSSSSLLFALGSLDIVTATSSSSQTESLFSDDPLAQVKGKDVMMMSEYTDSSFVIRSTKYGISGLLVDAHLLQEREQTAACDCDNQDGYDNNVVGAKTYAAVSCLVKSGNNVLRSTAVRWASEAVLYDQPRAMVEVGLCYELGRREYTIDEDYAVTLYRQAAELGYPEGLYNLGRAYRDGLGELKQDDAKAHEYFERAIAAGTSKAIVALANSRYDSVGFHEKAAQMCLHASALSDVGAFQRLFELIAPGFGVSIGVRRDDIQVCIALCQAAAYLGNIEAMFSAYTLMSYPENSAKERSKAIRWLRKAANLKDSHAQFELAKLYETGDRVEQDDVSAFEWMLVAAENGVIEAMPRLSAMYRQGRGVPQSDVKAAEWLADQGEPVAAASDETSNAVEPAAASSETSDVVESSAASAETTRYDHYSPWDDFDEIRHAWYT